MALLRYTALHVAKGYSQHPEVGFDEIYTLTAWLTISWTVLGLAVSEASPTLTCITTHMYNIHLHLHIYITYTYIHTKVHTHAYIHTHVHTYFHTYTIIHDNTHTRTHIEAHAYVHIHTYQCIHAYIHTYTTIHNQPAGHYGWSPFQMYIKSTFLNGNLKQESYVLQVRGFSVHGQKGHGFSVHGMVWASSLSLVAE